MIQFSKMQALGNDFMIIDCITQKVNLSPKIVQRLGNRHFGVGFDQLLLVEPPIAPDCDFHYRIFNNDGSEVGHCGNGARCFAAFVLAKKLTNKKHIKISTRNTILNLQLINQAQIKVDMGAPIWEPKQIPFVASSISKTYLITIDKRTELAGVVSMGNPHCVIEVQDLDNHPVDEIGQQIETHQRFPQRTNVTFYQLISDSNIKVRTFERGAGETLSCGTGACATVAVAINKGQLRTDQPILVESKGGKSFVQWSGKLEDSIYLIGDAKFVFEGKINIYNL